MSLVDFAMCWGFAIAAGLAIWIWVVPADRDDGPDDDWDEDL